MEWKDGIITPQLLIYCWDNMLLIQEEMFLLMEAMNIVQMGQERNFSKHVKNVMA